MFWLGFIQCETKKSQIHYRKPRAETQLQCLETLFRCFSKGIRYQFPNGHLNNTLSLYFLVQQTLACPLKPLWEWLLALFFFWSGWLLQECLQCAGADNQLVSNNTRVMQTRWGNSIMTTDPLPLRHWSEQTIVFAVIFDTDILGLIIFQNLRFWASTTFLSYCLPF